MSEQEAAPRRSLTKEPPMKLSPLALLALVLAVPAFSTGCMARVMAEPVSSVAFDVSTTPYVVYEGQQTYWDGNSWYFRRNDRWHTYRQEPAELRRRRPAPPAVRQAPPAHREDERHDNRREDRKEEHRR